MLDIKRSTILFGFDAKNGIPNGDPYTGEQRFDNETQCALQSDVGIKRYPRELIIRMNAFNPADKKHEVYIQDVDLDLLRDLGVDFKNITGAAAQVKILHNLHANDADIKALTGGSKKGKKDKVNEQALIKALLLKCIDVRVFGGLDTTKGVGLSFTGPLQFHLLNPSLHKVELKPMQNTSVLQSDTDKVAGAMGTKDIVPYAFFNIPGEVSPLVAKETGCTEQDILDIVRFIWHGVNNYRSRLKSNQTSRYLIKINYSDPLILISDVDELISVKDPERTDYRSLKDLTFDFTKLLALIQNPVVTNVEYMIDPSLEASFNSVMQPVKNKLVKINL